MPERKASSKKTVSKRERNSGDKKQTSSKGLKRKKIKTSENVSNILKEKNLKESGLSDLAKFLTGEMELEKKEKEVRRLKEEAIEKQKELNKVKIQRGELVLEKDEGDLTDLVSENKGVTVVQKLTLFEWTAPIRLKFTYENKTFLTVVALSLVFILYLALLGHYGLMFALIALLFFIYVAGTTEAIEVQHQITTRGIESFEKLYEWFMLGDFWFSKKNDQ